MNVGGCQFDSIGYGLAIRMPILLVQALLQSTYVGVGWNPLLTPCTVPDLISKYFIKSAYHYTEMADESIYSAVEVGVVENANELR